MPLLLFMEKAILIAGIIRNPEIKPEDIFRALKMAFGISPSHISREMDFGFTTYYEKEMGRNLKRSWAGFFVPGEFFDAGNLADFKNLARNTEEKFTYTDGAGIGAVAKKRRVNIDPGYLTPSKIVLASTKDFSHRIYLSNGIYGEVTLTFSDGKYSPLPWTYPDYKTDVFMEFAYLLRGLLVKGKK